MAMDHRRGLGPRKVGGRYLCGYWKEEYEVVAVDTKSGPAGCSWSVTVRTVGEDETRTHCTPWDPRRDRIISEPAAQHGE